MIQEPMTLVVCSDIAGLVRGKAFPDTERPSRMQRGVGWTPTNVQITCFNAIADSPYGPFGDLILVPDKSTEVEVNFDDDGTLEHFIIGDIKQLDGTPWECCTRSLLQQALSDLETEFGLRLLGAFEHEFYYTGTEQIEWKGYSADSYRQGANLAGVLMHALRQAGLKPDTFMAEYGPCQFEATVAPALGVRAADECIIFRELARSSARRLDQQVSFSPLVTPEVVGNGLHIHMSLLDADDEPVFHDPSHPQGLSTIAGQFAAGVLKYMPAIIAFTAPSVISYQRLVPHRWSAAFNNLGLRDREAALRICPVVDNIDAEPSSQYNLEYRAADASASPYLQLAALIRAGLQGLREKLAMPQVTETDLSELTEEQLKALGVQRLPTSLDEALKLMRQCDLMGEWFSPAFVDIYNQHKQTEIAVARELDEATLIDRYASIY